MYSNAPAVPTYNPAPAAADGSAPQMQMPPSANQPYYSLPGQQMSLPPGAPVTTGIPASSQMPGYVAGQPAATMGQPQYHMGPQGGQGVGGGGGYQAHTVVPGAPTGYQTPTMHTQPAPVTQMYMPASTAAQQAPQPGAAEYQPYNMHGNCHTCARQFFSSSFFFIIFRYFLLQCFDAVGWAAGRASSLW